MSVGAPGPQPAGTGKTRAEGREAATAVRLDAVLREMVDRMAHQLKNPLQAVVVNLEVIRGRVAAGAAGEELEPFASAVEGSVRVLDRRLHLLVMLSRAEGEEPVRVDPLELAVDLVGALHLDREPAPVVVAGAEREEDARGGTVRLRPGHFVACAARLLDLARTRARGQVTVAGRPGPPGRILEASFRPDPGAGRDDAAWEEVVGLARGAGAEAERGRRGDACFLRLRFPEG